MRRFRRTTLIAIFCLAILAGLGLARRYSFEPQIWWLALLPALILLKHKNAKSLLLVIILGLGLGLWRGHVFMQKQNDLKALTAQKVSLTATVLTDSIYGQRSQIEFTANKAQLSKPYNKNLTGRFKISGFGAPMVYRGDRIQVEGKLYPTRGSNQARIAYGQLTRLGEDHSWINNFTRRFATGMQNALPEPNASFGLGLLIGQRNTLPQQLTDQLVMVGLVHIVAVSGYNLTILVRAASKLRLGSKYQQLLLSLSLIVIFLLITGFAASIVRAAIVSILTLWAWYYGRKIRPLLIIFFTAALTSLLNPFYIWGDLGWYLSFLAFFGVLVIAPIVAARVFRRPPRLVTLVAIETLSAEVMALPFIMLMFGQLSIIGLVANVLVVPLVPLAMLLSAVAAVPGMLLPQLSGWLAWPANLLLTYMLDVVRLLASIPNIFTRQSISLPGVLLFYAAVLLAVLAARRHIKDKAAVLTDKKLA